MPWLGRVASGLCILIYTEMNNISRGVEDMSIRIMILKEELQP